MIERTTYTIPTRLGVIKMTDDAIFIKDPHGSGHVLAKNPKRRTISGDGDWLTEEMAIDFAQYMAGMGSVPAPSWVDPSQPWTGIKTEVLDDE